MNTIWKFPLGLVERQKIEVPINSAFLHIGIDGNDDICAWFAVDPKSDKIEMEIIVAGTGHELPHVGDFLGTIVQKGYVWHYFCGPGNSVNKTSAFHYVTRDN